MSQTGMLPNTELQRNSFDASFGGKLSKKWSMDGNVKYIRTDSKNRPGVGYAGDNVLQQSIWTGRQVDWNDLRENYETTDQWGNNYNWNHSYQNNPFYTLYNNTKPMNRDRVIGYFAVTYKITDWLSARARTGTDFYSEKRRRIFAINTADHPNGELNENIIGLQENNSDIYFTATKRFTDDLDFTANLGANRMHRASSNTNINVPGLVVPGVYNVGNASGNPLVTDRSTEKAIYSVYGSVSLGYKNFLYLDVTGRNDWSSTLPVENNSYFYPSATLGFVLTEAVSLPSVFDMVKLRGGWAAVGNDTDPYQLRPSFANLDPWNGNPTFTIPNLLPNATLRPERTTSTEAGIELVMFKNRLSVDFTYYNALTNDQIIQTDIAPSSGATAAVTNAGSVRNSGVELMVQGAIVKTKDFKWTVGVNFAKNKSLVVSLADDVEAIRLGRYWSLDLEAREGEPFGTFRGLAALRDDDGNLILDGGMPQIDPNSSEKVLGTITPDWTGGISTSLSYKGVSLSALVDVRKGSDLFSVTYLFGRYAGVLEETLEGRSTGDEVLNGYVYDGVMLSDPSDPNSPLVPNDVPVLAQDWNEGFWYAQSGHDRSIFDATFVKLREVTLNYKMPNAWFDGTPIGGLEIGAYGRNLALLYSNVPHIDPETAFGSQTNVQGFEFGALPSARTIGFTLRAAF
jgi:outer membrane receptor protein involved in Fe transport